MPSLILRTVGRSYVVEGVREAGLDGNRLYEDLAREIGEGAAPLQLSKSSGVKGKPTPIDAVIVDRKAMTWARLRDRLREWVVQNGGAAAEWDGNSTVPGGLDTLRF